MAETVKTVLSRQYRRGYWYLRLLIGPVVNRIGPINDRPIFVVGNQKSGTTAVGALLAECGGVSFNNDPLHGRKEKLKDFITGDLEFARFVKKSRSAFRRAVIKDPEFTFLYSQIASVFPAAQFVFVIRDPRDNIRSVLNRLQIPGDLKNLRE